MCHRATLSDRVKPLLKTGHIDSLLSGKAETPEQKRWKTLHWEHAKIHRQVMSVQSAFDTDVEFINIVRRKENRNSVGEMFKGIGKGKCQTLIDKGIPTARALLECNGDDPAIKCRWKSIAQEHCDRLETKLVCLKTKLDAASAELDLDISILGDVNITADEPAADEPGAASAVDDDNTNEKPPPFSLLEDPTGHNCRVVSRQTINRIDMSDFQRRRPLQQAKMRSIKCRAWKSDWHYKLPSKIKVYTGRGKCFSP